MQHGGDWWQCSFQGRRILKYAVQHLRFQNVTRGGVRLEVTRRKMHNHVTRSMFYNQNLLYLDEVMLAVGYVPYCWGSQRRR